MNKILQPDYSASKDLKKKNPGGKFNINLYIIFKPSGLCYWFKRYIKKLFHKNDNLTCKYFLKYGSICEFIAFHCSTKKTFWKENRIFN